MSAKKTTSPAIKSTKAANAKPAKAKPQKAATAAKGAKAKKAKADGKMSALDAAAKVLGDTGEAMTTKQMIETMAAKNLWTSPGGATPWATLYTVVTMLPKAC
jgi:hypothetical protein